MLVRRDEVEALVPAWTALHSAAGCRNPFAHPAWLLAWADHWLGGKGLHVVALRGADGLVGVAPFHRRPVGPDRLGVRALIPLGTGFHDPLTEIPQILLRPGSERRLLRALLAHLVERADEWDLAQVPLTPEQGWFEPHWVPVRGDGPRFSYAHKATRPYVVLPLPETSAGLRAGLKRNVRESVRRSRNRLRRAAGDHAVRIVDGRDPGLLDVALRDLVRLHRARAAVPGRERHADYFETPGVEGLLRRAVPALARAGQVEAAFLDLDAGTAAARLTLRAADATFMSLTGLEPRWWDVGPSTMLTYELLERAVGRGDRLANLSLGPDIAKLRWSERLELHQDFVVVGPRRRARTVFRAMWQRRALRALR